MVKYTYLPTYLLKPQARQTRSLDNSNILHMLNNNTYTDFRIANKHILIPSYVIPLIKQNQNVTKLLDCIKCDK